MTRTPPSAAAPGPAPLRPAALTAAVAAGLVATLLLTAAVLRAGGRPLAWDRAAHDAVAGLDLGASVPALALPVLTQLGAGSVLYPVLALLGLVRWGLVHRGLAGRGLASSGGTSRATAVRLVALPLGVLAAGQALEAVLVAPLLRPLPGELVASGLSSAGSFSSGHACAAVLGWGLVALHVRALLPRARHESAAVCAALALTAGATRVGLDERWASDVAAGWLIGLVLLLIAVAVLPLRGEPTALEAAVSARALRAGVAAAGGACRRLGRWARTSPGAWSLPALAALVSLVPLVLTPADERLKDLLVYRGAGGVVGQGGEVYRYVTAFDMPFTYPPFAALLAEPLGRVPLGLLQLLWTVASLAAVVAVATRVLHPVVARLGLPVTVAVALLSTPVRSHLRFGQVGLLLVLLVGADLLGRSRRAGWGVGLAAAVKLTPAVFLPWLVLTRSWSRAWSSAAWAAGATLVGLVLLWPSAGDYVGRAATDTSRFGANAWPGNQSLRGALLRAGAPEALWAVLAAVVLVVALVGAVRLERAGHRLAAVGVLVAASVVVSPISWVHHLVWLAFPLAALVAAGRHRLAAAWTVVLVVPLPSLGTWLAGAGAPAVVAGLVVDLQGLTALAAALLLAPLLLRARALAPSASPP